MIIIIDNYDSFTYNLYQAIAQTTACVEVFRNDEISLTKILALNPAGIVISPGPGRPEQAGICIELIKTFHKELPIFGVCLGHQAIACAFGGEVILAPQPMHGKSASIIHRGEGLYKNLPQPFLAGRYHSLIVNRDTLPEVLKIESETADGLIMGMRHAEYPTYGVQFHPESILTPNGNQLIKNFVHLCQVPVLC